MIEYFFEDTASLSLKEDALSIWIDNVVNAEKRTLGNLCFIFCSDNYLLSINKQFLEHNYYTDVITFDYSNSNVVSGDVFISVDRIKDNAQKYHVSFILELQRVIVHGVLHLIGFNDKSESEKLMMTSKENKYLELLNYVE